MRYLLCISDARLIPDPSPGISVNLPGGMCFAILEGWDAVTPFGMQSTHVGSRCAETLAQRPGWEIVTDTGSAIDTFSPLPLNS